MPLDVEEVRPQAAGRWSEIINSITGIADDDLNPRRHGPCPKCGGTDRWRVFDDFEQTGGAICNQCGKQKLKDGFGVISWYCGVSFDAAIRRVADHLGIAPSKDRKPFRPTKARTRPARKPKPKKDSSADLALLPWDEMQVRIWCSKKKPLKPEAVRRLGGFIARYRNYVTVIALPVIDNTDQVRNYVIYNISGGMLSAGSKDAGFESIKIKNLNDTVGLLRTHDED